MVNAQSQEVFEAHSFHEAGVQLIFGKDVQMEVLNAKKDSRLDHCESLFQPVSTGHHSKVHRGVRLAQAGAFALTLLPHDVPGHQQMLEWEINHTMFALKTEEQTKHSNPSKEQQTHFRLSHTLLTSTHDTDVMLLYDTLLVSIY